MPRSATPIALAAVAALAACTRPATPAPAPAPRTAPQNNDSTRRASGPPGTGGPERPSAAQPLPPVPWVAGSLAVHVVYPAAGQLITSSDSTFVLGSLGNGHAMLTVNGQPARVYPNGAFMAFVANPPASAPQYDLIATLSADTVRATHAVRVRAPDTGAADTTHVEPDTTGEWVRLDDPSAALLSDTDATVVARPRPGDTYRWFFLPGTVVWRDRSENGYARLQVDSMLRVWVPDTVAHVLGPDTSAPRRVAGNGDVLSAPGWEDFVLPVGSRPAYFVEEGDRSLELTLYDTRGNTDIIRYPTDDSLIRRVEWAQVSNDRVRYTLHLSRPALGYLVLWDHGRFVLRVRRPPPVDRAHPLRGQIIALDAGHPPAGATGPTGLFEGNAVLLVAERLKTMLEAEGAYVVMTRTTHDAVGLDDRPVIARREGADVFVSIHLNALPDGVNPFTTTEGSATFFYRGQSEPLARAVQRGLVARMGLPDQGIVFRSLAVVRQTWMPSILCEGAFVIVPEQEAALRTAPFRDAYAQGIADGLRAYFLELGAAQ
jgi:N-acetylmuramoyl-L-alanine amidase